MEDFLNGVVDNVTNDIVNDINQKISDGANKIVGNAINNIAKYLPTDSEKKNFLERIDKIKSEGIEAAINGEDYQKYLNRGAYETSVYLANHYAKEILERSKKEFPRGKTRDTIFAALDEMSRKGIEGLCSGQSLEVIKHQLSTIGKAHLQKYVESQSRIWSKNIGDNLYRKIRFSGRGSRKKNKYLREGRDIFAGELAFQITDNFGAFLGGEKDFGQAVTDLTVNTAKNTAVTYTKKHGAELAAETFKTLAKSAEKRIGKGMISNGLGKLANSNTLMTVANVAYDIGKELKRLMNGEITKAEFLQIVGEKGTAAVVSSVFTAMGTMVAGPLIGAAIGSAVGYFATSVLFSSVMQTFNEAELSRKRYEAIHEFCEYSIREMERQRLEFEAKVKEFLSERQFVIDTSLDNYERAIKNNDFRGMISSLESINLEFGGARNEFRNTSEFRAFLIDDGVDSF